MSKETKCSCGQFLGASKCAVLRVFTFSANENDRESGLSGLRQMSLNEPSEPRDLARACSGGKYIVSRA